MNAKENFINVVREMLPPVFPRHALTELTAGLINSRTIANTQSKKLGPPSVLFKGKVGFEREMFITWLEGNISDDPRNQLNN